MKFRTIFYENFSDEELSYIADEASLIYEDDHDEVDYMLWLRDDQSRAEIRLADHNTFQIYRLDAYEESDYSKEALLHMLQSTKKSDLQYIEVA